MTKIISATKVKGSEAKSTVYTKLTAMLVVVILLIGCATSSVSVNKTEELTAYRYVYLPPMTYDLGPDDQYGLRLKLGQTLAGLGFSVLQDLNAVTSKNVPVTMTATLSHRHVPDGLGGSSARLTIYLIDAVTDDQIYTSVGEYQGLSIQADLDGALDAALQGFLSSYTGFNPTAETYSKNHMREKIEQREMRNSNKEEIEQYLSSSNRNRIEGIWLDSSGEYQIAIVAEQQSDDYEFAGIILDSEVPFWTPGLVKMEINSLASNQNYTGYLYTLFHDRRFGKLSFNGANEIIFETNQKNDAVRSLEMKFLRQFPRGDLIATSRPKEPEGRMLKGSGSGFLLPQGFVVTNHHVIEGADSFTITIGSGVTQQAFDARVIAEDINNDLALLEVIDFDGNASLEIPIRTRARVGESVVALGYPMVDTLGRELKVTDGIISALSGYQGDITSFQITAPVQPGNSGGPLFSENGELLGVINARITGAENVSYAVKAAYVEQLLLSAGLSSEYPLANTGQNKVDVIERVRDSVVFIEVWQ